MSIATSSQVRFFLVLLLAWYVIMAFEVGHMSVLIVDDDLLTRRIHQASLRRFGFTTFTTAEDGRQAVELCQSGGRFDIITMDFCMPVMNGVEATRILRHMGVDSSIIAVSADDDSTLKESFIEAGADQFFTKPLNPDKIASFLANM